MILQSGSELLMFDVALLTKKEKYSFYSFSCTWSIWIEIISAFFEESCESLEDVWYRIKYRVALWVTGQKSFKGGA